MTLPWTEKLNGFSSLSLLEKLICPEAFAAPSYRTVNVSDAPAAKLPLRPSVRVKWLGKLGVPSVNVPVPVF